MYYITSKKAFGQLAADNEKFCC